MKIVGLLRHAKSSRDDPHLADIDRPLTPRGVRAAELMGAGVSPTRRSIRSGPGEPARRRVIDTIASFETGYGKPLRPTYEPVLYENSAATLLNVLAGIGDEAERILLVGPQPEHADLGTTLAKPEDALRRSSPATFPQRRPCSSSFRSTTGATSDGEPGQIIWLLKPRRSGSLTPNGRVEDPCRR